MKKDKKSKYCIIIHIPKKEKRYKVVLFAHGHVTDFAVVRLGDEENLNIPQYNLTFDYGLKLTSHSCQFIRFKTNPFVMKYDIPNDVKVGFYVNRQDGTEVENGVVMRKFPGDSETTVLIALPNQNERFFLNIFAKYSNSDKDSQNYFNQLCLIRTGSDKNDQLTFCRIYDDFDNFGLNCITEGVEGITKTKKNPLVIEYDSFQRLNFVTSLKDENTDEEIKNAIVAQTEYSISKDKKSKYCFIIHIPKKEKRYNVILFAQNIDDPYSKNVPVTDFAVVRLGEEENLNIPQYNLTFDYGLKLTSHSCQFIRFKTNPFVMKYDIPNDVKVGFYVNRQDGTEVENGVVMRKFPGDSETTVLIALPNQNERFFLNIFAKYSNSDKDSQNYFNQLCLIRTGSDKNDQLTFCRIYDDFDNFGLNCITEGVEGITKTKKNPLVIEYDSFQRLNFVTSLKDENTDEEIKNAIVAQTEYSISKDKKSKYCFIIHIPKKEKRYKVIMFAQNKDDSNSKSLSAVTDFVVVRLGDEENSNIPQYNLTFDYGIKLTSHFSRLIKFETNPLTIEFEIPEDVKTGLYVVKEDGKGVENAILLQKAPQESKTTAQIALPKRDEKFYLNIFAKYSSDESLVFVGRLDLIREKSDKNDGLKLCLLHSDSTFIHSPIEYYLTWNKQYEFNYFIKDALDVALTNSSNKWFHFKKELDNIWRLKTTLSTKGNLSIWAKFKEGASFDAISSYIVK